MPKKALPRILRRKKRWRLKTRIKKKMLNVLFIAWIFILRGADIKLYLKFCRTQKEPYITICFARPCLCPGGSTLNIVFSKILVPLVKKSKEFKVDALGQRCLVFDQNNQCNNHFGII